MANLNMNRDCLCWWIAVIVAIAMCGPVAAEKAEETIRWVLDGEGQRPEPKVVIENVCAWPNLTRLPDGDIVALIYPSSVQLKDGRILTAYYAMAIPGHSGYHMGVVIWDPARTRER